MKHQLQWYHVEITPSMREVIIETLFGTANS